ncbi:uncharacterized protein LOC132714956 [Ruditapes philippinarum]|uniref:uncharacterized protein LOC132714956 n=1 Tax=Ruditapes philippinarum TaxID=129788 RepID=UPI00295B3A53|nr:uncharacterized protein LOC132714956 [Ruditapes philippinarum]
MYKLLALTFLAAIAIVLSYKCHVTDGDGQIHCGDINNMTCKDVNYTPFCLQIDDNPNVNMNGVCSCQEFCITTDDCSRGCGSSGRYIPKCVEAYHLSIERFCVCIRRSN